MKLKFNGFLRNSNPVLSTGSPLISVQKPKKLLKGSRKSVQSIWQSAGIADEPFEKLYRYSMERVADLVQSCPATEKDHHAWPGGLLAHILESCDYALRLRKGVNLPISGSPEERKKKADLYTYAVFAASLLGELGGSLRRQKITLYSRVRVNLGEWSPLAEDIYPKARYLKVEFRRDGGTISRSLSLMYATRILPRHGLQWIESDSEVLGEFLQAFSERPGGPIHDLAIKGFRASVNRAEPLAGTPYFGAETKTETESSVSRQKGRERQGAQVRKKGEAREPAGIKGTERAHPSAPAGRKENAVAGRAQKGKANGRREKPKTHARNRDSIVVDGHVKKQPASNQEHPARSESPDGFTAWLRKIIAESNQVGELFHVVDRGIFLVHPTIFVKYATEKSIDWNTVQRDFSSIGIHLKSTGQKSNDLWKARIQGERTMTIVTGWLVPKEKLGLEVEHVPDSKLTLMEGS